MVSDNEILIITSFNRSQPEIPSQQGALSRLGMDGEIIPTPGHSDDSVSLILGEGTAFTGELPGPIWGADPMYQVETSWRRIRALDAEMIYGMVSRLE